MWHLCDILRGDPRWIITLGKDWLLYRNYCTKRDEMNTEIASCCCESSCKRTNRISLKLTSQHKHLLPMVQNGKTRVGKSRAWRCVFDDTFSIVNVMRLTWNFLHVCPKCNWRENIRDRVIFRFFCLLLRPPFKMWPSCDIQNPANCAPFCTP